MRNLAFIAICLVVFCIPWQEMAIFSEVLSVSFVLGGLTIFLSALAVVMNLRIRKLPPALVVLTLYVVVSTASMFWSMDFDISRQRVHLSSSVCSCLANLRVRRHARPTRLADAQLYRRCMSLAGYNVPRCSRICR